MVKKMRIPLILLGAALLVTQYQNCTSSSENTMFDSSQLTSTAAAVSDPSKVSFSIKNVQSDLYVEGYDDHIQIGGICNTGGKKQNYFEYSLTPNDGQGTSNLNSQGAKSLKDTRCEDGRFYIVLPILCPKQGGPNIAGTTQAMVKVYLYAFDSFDAKGNMVNPSKVDQSIFVDLAVQRGCN